MGRTEAGWVERTRKAGGDEEGVGKKGGGGKRKKGITGRRSYVGRRGGRDRGVMEREGKRGIRRAGGYVK